MSSEESDLSSDDKSNVSFSDASSLLDVISCSSDVSLHSDASEDDIPYDNKEGHRDSFDKVSVSSCMSLSSTSSCESGRNCSAVVNEEWQRSHVVLPDVLPLKTIPRPNGSAYYALNKGDVCKPLKRCKDCMDILGERSAVKISRNLNSEEEGSFDILLSSANNSEKKCADISANHQRRDKMRDIETWMVDNKYNAKNKCFSNFQTLEAESNRILNFAMIHNFEALNIEEYVQSKKVDSPESLPYSSGRSLAIPITGGEIAYKDAQKDSIVIHKSKPRKFAPSWNMSNVVCKEQRSSQDKGLRQENTVANHETGAKFSNTNCPRLEIKNESNGDLQKSCGCIHPKNSRFESVKCPCACKKESVCSKVNQNYSTNHSMPSVTLRKKVISADGNSKKKSEDRKFSSTDQFEIYTMDASLLHANKCNKETEWIRKRRNDREEIRRRLAMDYDANDFSCEKINQNRYSHSSLDKLKSSNNLQICFVNEMFKDKDLQKSDNVKGSDNQCKLSETVPMSKRFSLPIPSSAVVINEKGSSLLQNNNNRRQTVVKRPKTNFIFNRPHSWGSWKTEHKLNPEDFLTAHLKLQTEARAALAQAKDMARMQMELEKQKKKKSPIADIVGLPFPDGKFLLSHNALVDLNVAQLQVIVNDLHSQIENLNEDLVKILLERDDLHMEQDSMLVDIEDLTRYLGLKGNSCSSLSTSS